MTIETNKDFEGWAIVEILGYRKLAGKVSTQELFGTSFLRLDVPGEGESVLTTQFYSAAAIYCLTPTTEEIARSVARHNQPEPVSRWELPQLRQPQPIETDDDDEDYDDEYEGVIE